MQIIELIVLFAFLVLSSLGWGAWGCQRAKLPARFLFLAGFTILSMLAYLGFFVFLLDAVTGRIAASSIGLLSVGMTLWQVAKAEGRKLMRQTDVWLPLLLKFLYAASCMLVVDWHGGDPARALRAPMPPDNILPEILADHFWNGGTVQNFWGITLLSVHDMGPFFGDWLSSDRPPLQAALFLVCRPLELPMFQHGDFYNVSALLFQSVWIPAVYLLARELQFPRVTLGLMLAWFAGSGFFLLHTAYAWPKLLAASLFLAGLAVILFCARNLPARNTGALLLLAVLWALALLSHGGIFFSFLAVPFLPTIWRVFVGSPASFWIALGVFVLMSLPWAAYQKFYDPPGNRLIKMHLAGVDGVDSRGILKTLHDSYTGITLVKWAYSRLGNVHTSLVGPGPKEAGAFQSVQAMRAYINEQTFCRVTGAVGLLNIGVIALIAGWLARKDEKLGEIPAWAELLWMNIACYMIWVLTIFRPDGAIVHQSSFAMIILFMMIGVWGLTKLPTWAGFSLLGLQWFLFSFGNLYYYCWPESDAAVAEQIGYWALVAIYGASLWVFLPREIAD